MSYLRKNGQKSYLKLRLKRSLIGYPQDQRATAKALGLTRVNRVVIRPNNPCARGMVRKIQHLVEVEEIDKPEKVRR
ncbi:MAG TPA: 50S ribosomal protein L30 [Armatimonadetes bacterium]|nr:50S ribosomal protein L30 [Armatimonadota bacterium]